MGVPDIRSGPRADLRVHRGRVQPETIAFSAGLSKSRAVRTEHHTNSGQPAPLISNLSNLKGALHVYDEVKGRPPYVVSKFLVLSGGDGDAVG